MEQDTRKQRPDVDARLFALEQDLIGIASLIRTMSNFSPDLAERYACILRDIANQRPKGASGIAAVLRTFLREIEGQDYHVGVWPDLIGNALQAAEQLANEEFSDMVAIFREEAAADTAVVPLEPDSSMLTAGAQAGGVGTDVARRVYSAMVSLCIQKGTPP